MDTRAPRKKSGTALVIDGREKSRLVLAEALSLRYDRVLPTHDVNSGVRNMLYEEVLSVVVVSIDTIDNALDVVTAAHLAVPTPLVVAIHEDDLPAAVGFDLARMGAVGLLKNPDAADLLRCLDEAQAPEHSAEPGIVPWVAPYVGNVGLFDFEKLVRKALVLQAIARTGSRVQAARLLRAPRAVIQRAEEK